MTHHVPDNERLDRPALHALQRDKLRAMLAFVLRTNRFQQARIPGGPDTPCDDLPFTTREELERDQTMHPPYGTNLTCPLTEYVRLHQTSGTRSGAPLRWLDRPDDWNWWKTCWNAVYRGADVSLGDRLIFPFSFGPFIGFWAAFETALERGCLCLPAGGMTTSARLRFLLDNAVTVVCCTPTYALHLAEVAEQEGLNLPASPVRALIVAGEPGGSLPAIRARIEQAFGARIHDHAGMTEIGAYAFQCHAAPGCMHLLETEFIAEIIDPKSARPVPDGEIGELVLTNLGRWGMPLIRYRTGDAVRRIRGDCSCGRTLARLEGGVIGRTDAMLIIRGNNVYPSALDAILRAFTAVAEYRLTVYAQGADLLVELEPKVNIDASCLCEQVTQAIRDRLNFRPDARLVPPGSLPRHEMKSQRIVHIR